MHTCRHQVVNSTTQLISPQGSQNFQRCTIRCMDLQTPSTKCTRANHLHFKADRSSQRATLAYIAVQPKRRGSYKDAQELLVSVLRSSSESKIRNRRGNYPSLPSYQRMLLPLLHSKTELNYKQLLPVLFNHITVSSQSSLKFTSQRHPSEGG